MKVTKICEKRCDQCLFSDAKIVSEDRKKDLIRDLIQKGMYFECHKGTIANEPMMCKGWYDKYIPQDSITKLCFDIGKYEFSKIPEI